MADPITNTQFINSLFSPAAAQMQRMNSQRLALAETGMRRAWQLQDAAARAEQNAQLQASEQDHQRRMFIAGLQKDIGVQELRNLGQLNAVEEASRRSKESTDAITERQIDAERRKAYETYTQLGGSEPIESFGTGEDALGKIRSASGKLQLSALKARIEVGGQFVKSRAANLRALTNDKEIESQAAALAVRELGLNASGDNAATAIADLSAGREKVGLQKLSPEDRALYVGLKQKAMIGLRAQQYKDPQVVDAIRGLREAQSGLMKLVQDAPALGEADVRSIFSLIPDVDEELGVKQAAPDFSKYFPGVSNGPTPASTKPVAAAPASAPTGPMFKYPATSVAGASERAVSNISGVSDDPLKILRMAALAGSGGSALFREPSDTDLSALSFVSRNFIDKPLSMQTRGLAVGDWSMDKPGFAELAGNKVADSIIAARDTYDATMPALRTAGSAAGRSLKDYLLRALINRNAAEEPTTP